MISLTRIVRSLASVSALVAMLAMPASADENLALGKPAVSSGPNWGTFQPAAITDGDATTFTHPADAAGTLGFYYEVDLGRSYRLDRIVLRNRGDGCCTERLSDYRVEVYADSGGDTGALNWSADVRTDGSNSGVNGVDTIKADAAPAGTFAGRFVRVVNGSGAAYNPQVAELEVYGGAAPVIVRFAPDKDVIDPGQGTTLRWETVNATSAAVSPGIGPVAVTGTGGSVSVKPAVTTTYTFTASNENGSVSATATIGVGVGGGAPPRINEFLADNSSGLKDEDGDPSDWIELGNPDRFGLDAGGRYLTDDPTDLRKWLLPAVRIPGGGSLLVFASGKDRRDPRAQLHTNFKIGAGGDYLALVDRDGKTVLQQFPADFPVTKTFPKQFPDISYGIGPDGATGFFRPPSPGATNGPSFAGFVADTKSGHDRGFYDTNLTVEITTATPGATIRYTTDRTAPTATKGLVYSGPVPVTTTTVLRAAAFKDGFAPTEVDTHTYLFPTHVIDSTVMRKSITTNALYRPQMRDALLDLPSVSLSTTSLINGTAEVKTSFEYIRPDGVKGVQSDCGVRLYGGAYTDFAKKSFRLYFRSEFGPSKLKYPIFAGHEHGLAAVEEFDQLELRNCSHDMEMRGFYMSNICTDDTLLEMGQLNPHGRFVHLYLNGTYWGLYHLRERWGASMHQRYLGGSVTNYESINGNLNVGGWSDGTVYDGDGSVWKRVKALRGDYQAVKPWLDVAQYTDYMVMFLFGGSEDEYRCVGPNVPGSGMKFYLNDADGWFCVPNYCAAGNRTARSSPGKQSGDGPGSIFSMLFKQGDPDHRILLADRIQRALSNDGALTPARTAARLTNRTEQIRRAFLAESARWNYLTPAAWAMRRDSVLNTWLPRRTSEALGQFRSAGFYPSLGAPLLNQQGGMVTNGFPVRFPGPPGATVWYTLDGTDPRLPGGAVSPSARSYNPGGSSEVPVPAGSRWRWSTDAAGLSASDVVEGSAAWSATDWKHPAFDDGAWKEGPAQLGYGEGDEATVIPSGPVNDKWVSSYFRHPFTLKDTTGVTVLLLRLKRDDGAIVYLNGHEAARMSIRAGTVTATTPGDNASDDGQSFNELPIDPALLRTGTNIVAVELHQASPTTSDASFDLELSVTRSGAAGGSLPTIAKNTVIKSRAKNATQWSAINEAFFRVGPDALAPGDVVVSEIDFNPHGDDGSEHLVLANLSDHAVDLRGARFTDGIRFVFPSQYPTLLAPGQRLVLVNDLFHFQQRHGIDIPVGGIFTGALSNGGERITFADAASNGVSSFRYDGARPWPTGADGGGYSLVLAHPQLGLDDPAAWRTSATTNGVPGISDATVFAGDATADADGDGLPALLEHALGTSDTDARSGPGAMTSVFTSGTGFSLTTPRNLRADDVTLRAEYSTDLGTWKPASLGGTRPAGPGLATETWEVVDSGQSAMFLRLRVTRP